MTDYAELVKCISAYLQAGGLFNPELMDHAAVRDLLIECRSSIEALVRERDEADRKASIAVKSVKLWQGEAQQNFQLGREAGMREAAGKCEPHEDDDSLDRQCKRECQRAILALLDKPA